MQVCNLLHKWNEENDQACNKLPTSFQLVRLVDCGLYCHKSRRKKQDFLMTTQRSQSWGAGGPQYFAKGVMHQSGPSNN